MFLLSNGIKPKRAGRDKRACIRVALAASYLPARLAARVDPLVALVSRSMPK